MAEFTCIEQTGFGLANILPRRGASADMLGAALGANIAPGARASHGDGITLLGTAPGQWLAYAPAAQGGWADTLATRLEGTAGVVDQSAGYVLYTLAGADAARLLQKGLSVDMSEAAMPVDSVVVSVIAHIGVIVHRAGPATFHIAIFRSFAGAFGHWLEAAASSL
ncbi:MAG TPA: sarcosine oxidase subunit gamma family protein [Novosphingobium sp.]|nr:sarcosine oxidase subunit gamma family protein [Novosphingobium sp.]